MPRKKEDTVTVRPGTIVTFNSKGGPVPAIIVRSTEDGENLKVFGDAIASDAGCPSEVTGAVCDFGGAEGTWTPL